MADGTGLTFANNLLALIFNGASVTGVAMNISSGPLTNLYVALHTADPTTSGSQNTSECNYTGYARVAVARTSSGWVVVNNTVSPAATIAFPTGTGGTGTASYWSVGSAATGAGELFYVGVVSPAINTGNTVTPQLTTSSTLTFS
jgi:hypothetical protein